MKALKYSLMEAPPGKMNCREAEPFWLPAIDGFLLLPFWVGRADVVAWLKVW